MHGVDNKKEGMSPIRVKGIHRKTSPTKTILAPPTLESKLAISYSFATGYSYLITYFGIHIESQNHRIKLV